MRKTRDKSGDKKKKAPTAKSLLAPLIVGGPTCPQREVVYILTINELSYVGGSVSEPCWLVFRTF